MRHAVDVGVPLGSFSFGPFVHEEKGDQQLFCVLLIFLVEEVGTFLSHEIIEIRFFLLKGTFRD